MIRNYRFHLVRDPVKEGINEQARSLFELNRGTSIPVSNSIIRPERYKFSTKVSETIQHVYPLLRTDGWTNMGGKRGRYEEEN
jgi:hypothetical protein